MPQSESPVGAPRNEAELDDRLSEPTAGVIGALRHCPGDVLVLGAGGKMGPTVARMVRRASDAAGTTRRVFAVSRFGSAAAAERLTGTGIDIIRADLADRRAVGALPDAPNVFFLAGQKFGTSGTPGPTWMANVVIPAVVAERFREARIVALSTGNVYERSPVSSRGSREEDAPGPVGEYAWSCLARERVLEHASRTRQTPIAMVRLNYAVDLRYGVLVDLALAVSAGTPIDLRMGYVNVIWQCDACAQVIQCLPLVAVPPFVLNVTGPETLSVRALAVELGRLMGREPVFTGRESNDALLSDSSRARDLFGPPSVSAERLLALVAEWIRSGGTTLGKATHFEERGGSF